MNTRIHLFTAAALAATTLAAAKPATAQWSVEGRVGSSLPRGELTDAPGLDQAAGLSFAADAMYGVDEHFTAYAGASRESFHCDACSTDVTSAGLDGGVKYRFGRSGSAIPWARGGLIWHRASVDGVDGDWGLGVDAGVGLDWFVRPSVALVPALRLDSYSSGPLSLSYFTIDLGLHLELGR